MSSDPLFFLKDATLNTTALNASTHSSGPAFINPSHFFVNIVLVLALLYFVIFLLKHLQKKGSSSHSSVLKEVVLNPTLRVLYVRLNSKLYLLAQSSQQVILLDTLSNAGEIVKALTDEEEAKPSPRQWFSWLKLPVRKPVVSAEFDQTLQKIIKNSNDLEGIHSK